MLFYLEFGLFPSWRDTLKSKAREIRNQSALKRMLPQNKRNKVLEKFGLKGERASGRNGLGGSCFLVLPLLLLFFFPSWSLTLLARSFIITAVSATFCLKIIASALFYSMRE